MIPTMQKLLAERDRIDQTIKKLQERCKHPKAEKTPKGSTGNWDRDDSYWYVCHCPRCNKRWTEPQ